jgi:uncharacterized Zn-binding protein involved in type VI secretion
MTFAARLNDLHVCPMSDGSKPHVGGPILPGANTTVNIGGQPAAVVGDSCTCSGPTDSILSGSGSVKIGNKPAARMGDSTAHGGKIVKGCPTVIIGG